MLARMWGNSVPLPRCSQSKHALKPPQASSVWKGNACFYLTPRGTGVFYEACLDSGCTELGTAIGPIQPHRRHLGMFCLMQRRLERKRDFRPKVRIFAMLSMFSGSLVVAKVFISWSAKEVFSGLLILWFFLTALFTVLK